jgi:hypothetical protein
VYWNELEKHELTEVFCSNRRKASGKSVSKHKISWSWLKINGKQLELKKLV